MIKLFSNNQRLREPLLGKKGAMEFSQIGIIAISNNKLKGGKV